MMGESFADFVPVDPSCGVETLTALATIPVLASITVSTRPIDYGSVNLWRGNLLTSNDAQLLNNQKPSRLLVTMTCLNRYFMDPRPASLGEAFIRVHQGGAVSVWAPSAITDTGNQTVMNQTSYSQREPHDWSSDQGSKGSYIR
jgi:hypothetical protein